MFPHFKRMRCSANERDKVFHRSRKTMQGGVLQRINIQGLNLIGLTSSSWWSCHCTSCLCSAPPLTTEMIGHLSLQRSFQHGGYLLQQTVFANNVFRLLVVGQSVLSRLPSFLLVQIVFHPMAIYTFLVIPSFPARSEGAPDVSGFSRRNT